MHAPLQQFAQHGVGVQKFGSELLNEGLSLIDLVVAATDAEKDPRCLMLAFMCFKLLGSTYPKAGQLSKLQVTPWLMGYFAACQFCFELLFLDKFLGQQTCSWTIGLHLPLPCPQAWFPACVTAAEEVHDCSRVGSAARHYYYIKPLSHVICVCNKCQSSTPFELIWQLAAGSETSLPGNGASQPSSHTAKVIPSADATCRLCPPREALYFTSDVQIVYADWQSL